MCKMLVSIDLMGSIVGGCDPEKRDEEIYLFFKNLERFNADIDLMINCASDPDNALKFYAVYLASVAQTYNSINFAAAYRQGEKAVVRSENGYLSYEVTNEREPNNTIGFDKILNVVEVIHESDGYDRVILVDDVSIPEIEKEVIQAILPDAEIDFIIPGCTSLETSDGVHTNENPGMIGINTLLHNMIQKENSKTEKKKRFRLRS